MPELKQKAMQIPAISPNYYFRLRNGQIVKHIRELPIVLESMDDYTFQSYVTPYKNDFAKWIYDVYRKKELADLIGATKSKAEIIRLLNAYLAKIGALNAKRPQVKKTIKEPPKLAPVQQPATQKLKQPQPAQPQQPQQVKKPVQQPVAKPKQTSAPAASPQPVKKPVQQPVVMTSADEYFEKNPILMSQIVSAKQKTLQITPLQPIEYKGTESVKELDETFKDTYTKAYERLVFLRKNGFDTSIAQVMLFRIPAKIKVFEASKTKKDVILIKRYLNEVIEELNSIS